MEAMSHRRSCVVHPLRYISHVCLKEDCGCAGILCEQCIRGKHGHARPPLANFNINSSRSQHSDYFSQARDDIIKIWDQGNQILERQKAKIQKTILFQLNLIHNTFVYSSPYQIEKNLKYCNEQDQDQLDQLQQGINLLRSLEKNMDNIQNINQIKENTGKVYDQITGSLKHSFIELNRNFDILNETLNRVNIFQKEVIKKQCSPLDKQLSNQDKEKNIQKDKEKEKSKMLIQQKPKSQVIPPIVIPPLLKQASSNYKQTLLNNPTLIQIPYKQNQKFCLENSILAKPQAVNNTIKYLKIKQCRQDNEILDFFLNNKSIEYLVIEEKRIATSSYLHLIFQCLSKLKIMVISCPNQISQWASILSQIDVDRKGTSLERLQYCYDFRRDLQELDEDRYFPNKKFSIKFAQQRSLLGEKQIMNGDNDLGQLAYWQQTKSYLGLVETLSLQKKFNLKNIWIADLSKNNFVTLKQQDINFKNIEQAIIGSHDHTFLPIPRIIEAELIKTSNLKSLVLIKTTGYVLNFSNMLKKLNNLDVLVLEQFKLSGDEKDIIKLYNSIGVSACPQLQKLLITDLKNVSLNFIANLPFLTTLILPRSKNLQFNQVRMLVSLKHLNLYCSDWDYTNLINRLFPAKVTHLNLGMGKTEFKMNSNRLKDFYFLESLCLDGMNLNELIVNIIENNQLKLRKLSLAFCLSNSIYAKMKMKIAQNLNKCKHLQILDIHKFDMEQEIIDNNPMSLKTLFVSAKKSIDKLNRRKVLSATNLSVHELH